MPPVAGIAILLVLGAVVSMPLAARLPIAHGQRFSVIVAIWLIATLDALIFTNQAEIVGSPTPTQVLIRALLSGGATVLLLWAMGASFGLSAYRAGLRGETLDRFW